MQGMFFGDAFSIHLFCEKSNLLPSLSSLRMKNATLPGGTQDSTPGRVPENAATASVGAPERGREDGWCSSFFSGEKKEEPRKKSRDTAECFGGGRGWSLCAPERWAGVGTVYFLFSGEKRKVPKKKAVMPPNPSAVEGFEAITRRSDGEGGRMVFFFLFRRKERRTKKEKP